MYKILKELARCVCLAEVPQYNITMYVCVLCKMHTISFPQAMHRQCYEYAKQGLRYGELCDNIGLVGVSAKWSYVTASPSHHDQAIPILSPLLFMHVGHPYIPFIDLLVRHAKAWRQGGQDKGSRSHGSVYTHAGTITCTRYHAS